MRRLLGQQLLAWCEQGCRGGIILAPRAGRSRLPFCELHGAILGLLLITDVPGAPWEVGVWVPCFVLQAAVATWAQPEPVGSASLAPSRAFYPRRAAFRFLNASLFPQRPRWAQGSGAEGRALINEHPPPPAHSFIHSFIHAPARWPRPPAGGVASHSQPPAMGAWPPTAPPPRSPPSVSQHRHVAAGGSWQGHKTRGYPPGERRASDRRKKNPYYFRYLS